MGWKVLIIVLTLDLLYRICRYGKWEIQQLRAMVKKRMVGESFVPRLVGYEDSLKASKTLKVKKRDVAR